MSAKKPIKATRETIYIWMQPNEDVAVADCGCTLYRTTDDADDPAVVLCQLHSEAEKLRTELEAACELIEGIYGRRIADAYRRGDASREERDCVVRARALIVQTERAR